MSMTELDVMHLRTEQSMEGVPSCGWCGDWSASSELFECDTCSAREHYACHACRTKKASPCKDWEECMWCGDFLVTPVLDFFCSDICAALEYDDADGRTCQACLRRYDGPIYGASKSSRGYCSATCEAMERGDL